jgi:phenylpropionate dioxygenase-like ring-hydroxylating dioxygenase large terminal subunit
MPCTVDIEFAIEGMPGVRRHLWMTASPVSPGVSRTFWMVARNDRHAEADQTFLDFQLRILAEDEPVVCNQVPPELPLGLHDEISVRTDRVSVEYRRWIRELVAAARQGPGRLASVLCGPGAGYFEEVSHG